MSREGDTSSGARAGSTDTLGRLARRAGGATAQLLPRLPALFEGGGPATHTGFAAEEGLLLDRVGAMPPLAAEHSQRPLAPAKGWDEQGFNHLHGDDEDSPLLVPRQDIATAGAAKPPSSEPPLTSGRAISSATTIPPTHLAAAQTGGNAVVSSRGSKPKMHTHQASEWRDEVSDPSNGSNQSVAPLDYGTQDLGSRDFGILGAPATAGGGAPDDFARSPRGTESLSGSAALAQVASMTPLEASVRATATPEPLFPNGAVGSRLTQVPRQGREGAPALPSAPAVHVTIGRVEVRAPAALAATRRQETTGSSETLASFLAKREQRR